LRSTDPAGRFRQLKRTLAWICFSHELSSGAVEGPDGDESWLNRTVAEPGQNVTITMRAFSQRVILAGAIFCLDIFAAPAVDVVC
jgi:hypothetical protein